MTQFYTYIHCKPDGTPFYVGKGCGYRARNLSSRNPQHRNTVTKYGRENILIFIFECETEKEAFSDEVQQIKQLKSEGYQLANFTDGGEGASGRVLSEEVKSKLSSRMKGNKLTLGRRHSEQSKKLMSIAASGKPSSRKGKPLSEEHKRRISESNMGRPAPGKGKPLSEETKLKLSLAKKGISFSEEHRKQMSIVRMGKPHPQKRTTCPHCGLTGRACLMTRYHFTNCKHKK